MMTFSRNNFISRSIPQSRNLLTQAIQFLLEGQIMFRDKFINRQSLTFDSLYSCKALVGYNRKIFWQNVHDLCYSFFHLPGIMGGSRANFQFQGIFYRCH